MTYEEALEKLVSQGAIRAYRISENWGFAYRLRNGKVQARGFNTLPGEDGEWRLGDHMVHRATPAGSDGWYDVRGIPPQAKLIELEAAKKNPGYYTGLTRQCATCKKIKPLYEFEREVEADKDYRPWECNECFGIRQREVEGYSQDPDRYGGDYIKRDTYVPKPPVKGKI